MKSDYGFLLKLFFITNFVFSSIYKITMDLIMNQHSVINLTGFLWP